MDRRVVGLAVVLAAASLLAGCGTRSAVVGSPGRPATAADVTGVDWQLVETSVDGQRTDVTALDQTLHFPGDGTYGGHVCNYFGGTVELSDGSFTFHPGSSTSMACGGLTGRTEAAVSGVLQGPVTASVVDAELLLAAHGNSLRWRHRDALYPSRTLTSLVQGERGEAQYRLGWESSAAGVGVELESRPRPGTGWGFVGFGRTAAERVAHLEPSWGSVGEEAFVFGPVPNEAARAEFLPPGGRAVSLQLVDVPAARTWRVFAGFVGASAHGVVIAYDAAGRELMRSRLLPG